jgi:hypothetical protein
MRRLKSSKWLADEWQTYGKDICSPMARLTDLSADEGKVLRSPAEEIKRM